MKKRFTKLLTALAMLVFMTPSMAGWGQTRTNYVINTTNFENINGGTGYAAYNGNHEIGDVTITSYQVMVNSNKLQFQTNKGYLYNADAMPGEITKITLATATNFTIYVGTEAQPNTTTVSSGATISGSYTYFQIKAGSSTPSTATITVEYTSSGGGGSDQVLTFPFTSNISGWPTTNSSTLANYTYTLDNVDYTFALKNVKCNGTYLMVYSVGVVGLPAIEGYKLTKVVAHNSTGCSTSTRVGISSSSSSASYITGGSYKTWTVRNTDYTYNLSSTEANTMYYMYVTNANAQVTQLELTYEYVAPSTDPAINVDSELAVTPVAVANGELAVTYDNIEPTSGTITLYDAQDNDITESCTWFTPAFNADFSKVTYTATENISGAVNSVRMHLNVSDGTDSAEADVTVTQDFILTTMDQIFARATTNGNTEKEVTINFNNWVITGQNNGNSYATAPKAWLTDGTKGCVIYGNTTDTYPRFQAEDKLYGVITCNLKLNTSYAQITGVKEGMTGLTTTHNGGVITPVTNKTIAELSAINTGSVVTLTNLTYSSSTQLLSDENNNTIRPYNHIYSSMSFTDGKTYNVTGVFETYSSNPAKKIYPLSSGIVEVGTITANPTSMSFTYTVGGSADNQTLAISGSDLTEDISGTLTGDDFAISDDNGSTWENTSFSIDKDNGGSILVRLNPDLAVGDSYSGSITLSSTGANDVIVPLTGSVTKPSHNLAQKTDPATAHGTISFSPASPVIEDDIVTLSAAPATGYKLAANSWVFYKWDGENYVIDTDVTATNDRFTMPAYDLWVDATFVEKNEVTYDFSQIEGFSSWTNSYMQHVVEYDEATVTFANANRQTSTITDIPVTNGGDVTIVLTSGATLTGATFECRQWGSKAQTITLHYSTNGGTTYTSTGTTSSNFSITNNNLPDGTNAVRIRFSGSNQVGIESATLRFAGQKHAITLASVSNGTISANKATASAGQTVTLTATPNSGYALDTWDVYKTGASGTKVTVDANNQFVMPDYPVTVSATFAAAYTLIYSVNGVTSTADYVQGTTVTLPTPTENIPTGFNFLGWTVDANNVNTLLTSYTLNSAATLYAVFGRIESITLTKSNVPAEYANDETEITAGGIKFGIFKIANYNQDYIQVQGNSDYHGYIYNKDAFNNLCSIVATQSGTYREVTLKAGSTANPTDGTTISPSTTGLVDTYTIAGNYNYIFLQNTTTNALRYISIVFNFSDPDGPRYIRVFQNETVTATIEINGPSIIPSGKYLNMGDNTLTNTTAANLVIEDGGQLITSSNNVAATVKKNITAASQWGNGDTYIPNNWYFIAAPIKGSVSVDGLRTTGEGKDYDLYTLKESTSEWINQKEKELTIAQEKGYLYASEAGTTVTFAGTVQPNVPAGITVGLEKALEGWNLVGNPFPFDVYVNHSYYELDGERKTTEPVEANTKTIAPCTAIVVKAESAEDEITFKQTAFSEGSLANNGDLQMTLTQTVANSITRGESSSQTLDKAIVSFNEGGQLVKFYFGTQDANLYIPMDNVEYAIVSSSAQGEMPVNFRAYVTGEYTITVNPEEVEMGYLHLIDNIAGVEVDLLANPSYTFNARYDDYESRFRLVFSANMVNADLNDDFAFFSNGQLVVANEGEAILQVIDVNGRIVATESINGTCSKAINAKAGVYVLRLINGTDVKTQKIIVK